MTSPAPSGQPASSGYGSAEDWATIISGAGRGAQTAMQGASAAASSRKEAREAKRRTLANILSAATKRRQGLFRAGQEHTQELQDTQAQAMQQVARGIIESLQGSTG